MVNSEGFRKCQEGNSPRKTDATEENSILGLILKYLGVTKKNNAMLKLLPSELHFPFVTMPKVYLLSLNVNLSSACDFTETQYCIYHVCNDEENLYCHTC